MKWRMILPLSLLVFAEIADAAPSSQIVSSAQVVSTSISYKISGKTKTKTIYCLGKVPGTVRSISEGLLFTPIATTIAKLKAKKITGIKLQTQIAIKKSGAKACAQLVPGSSPTPSNGATPTPTLSPSNFTGTGDVTASGKAVFKIPSNLTANISKGRALSASYCSCHTDKLGKTFPVLRTSIAVAPMYFDSTQITDQMLADITAYLNRYNLGF
jgi:hypothetical protein